MPAGKKAVRRVRPKPKSATELEEVRQLEQRIADGAPPSGSTQPAPDVPKEVNYANRDKFAELPLSRFTKDALREAKFEALMAIQKAAIPHALAGRDVLGAAKTGSGKTLAFLIPVLEKLYRLRWNRLDGLGALILSPTRELALQIFGELRKVGKFHDFSAGLLIGGKDVKEEQERVNRLNILVACPGRLLQHMDQTPGFDASQLQILVLDEADRCLSMGFARTLDSILENLPRQRQVLLFSATQTKELKDLKKRLGLDAPEFISVHAEAAAPTPVRLQQSYLRCDLPQKLDLLWSFLRTHVKAKTLVFFSTCKQVQFVYEAFRRLRPGVSLRDLHGRMKQYKRMKRFQDFTDAKEGMVLFATDVAARGLDFPAVDWVIQLDCPEDVATYIHRVGRTARLHSTGHSLLMLLPSEEEHMLAALRERNIPLRAIKVNPKRTLSVTPALQALLSKSKDMKDMAQRALTAYLRSVFLHNNKKIFNVLALPSAEFALSLGMPSIPELRIVKRAEQQAQKDAEKADARCKRKADAVIGSARDLGNGNADVDDNGALPSAGRGPANGLQPSGEAQAAAQASEEDEDFLVTKRRHEVEVQVSDVDEGAAEQPARKRRRKLKIQAGKGNGTRLVFDDDGAPADPLELMVDQADHWEGSASHASKEARFQAEAEAIRAVTKDDRARKKAERARRKAEARERARAGPGGGAPGVQLAGGDPDDGGDRDAGVPPAADSDASRSPSPVPAASCRADPAYLGMQPAPGEHTDRQTALDQPQRAAVVDNNNRTSFRPPRAVEGNKGGSTSGAAGGVDALTVEEQEALVLRLLART